MPRTNSKVVLTREERLQLESIARSRAMPHGLVRRVQIVLGSADGLGTSELARQHRVSRPMVSWPRRERNTGLAGLHTELRPGQGRAGSGRANQTLHRAPQPDGAAVRMDGWTATADSIHAKIDRLCKVIGGTQH